MGIVHNAPYRFKHTILYGFPRVEVESRNAHATDNDVVVAERVLVAFHRATAKDFNPKSHCSQ